LLYLLTGIEQAETLLKDLDKDIQEAGPGASNEEKERVEV
jgi:hypothetical protein